MAGRYGIYNIVLGTTHESLPREGTPADTLDRLGLDGIERGLALEPEYVGNAYTSDSQRVPASMNEALALWEASAWIRDTFGVEVQEHYANMARVELAAFGSAVTDWERFRNFERI